jgi:hypothetical protein
MLDSALDLLSLSSTSCRRRSVFELLSERDAGHSSRPSVAEFDFLSSSLSRLRSAQQLFQLVSESLADSRPSFSLSHEDSGARGAGVGRCGELGYASPGDAGISAGNL